MNDVLLVVIAVAVVAALALLLLLVLRRGAGEGEGRELRRELAEGLDRGSHALITQLTSIASVGAGADGIIVEIHPDPDRAKSDGGQSLTLTQELQMVSGTLGSTPITAGKLKGDEITFTAGSRVYTGRVNGDRMSGVGWSATRAR